MSRIQQTHCEGFHPRAVPRDSGKLHSLAETISRRHRRTSTALPTAADGRLIHAGTCRSATPAHPGSERAGGSLVNKYSARRIAKNYLGLFRAEPETEFFGWLE